ncbi:hypothetical protein FGF1_41580 [Flavobacteriaceae bacterium GF1]
MYAQESGHAVIPKTLYVFGSYGDLNRYNEKESLFLITEERELYDENAVLRVDTILIKERIDYHNYIIARPGRASLGLLQRDVVIPDSIYVASTYIEGKSVEEVKKKFKDAPKQPWFSLLNRQLFTKAKMEKMKEAPGLDEITRKDLLESLSWREAIGKELKAYLDSNPGMSPNRIYRMVENYRNQKLVLLGYNPYKQVVYNWQKQFDGDEEIIKLLTEPISFD